MVLEGRSEVKWSLGTARIILKCILKKYGERRELDGSHTGQGQLMVACECGYEPLGCTQFEKFLD
jgi:hypothetical protein